MKEMDGKNYFLCLASVDHAALHASKKEIQPRGPTLTQEMITGAAMKKPTVGCTGNMPLP